MLGSVLVCLLAYVSCIGWGWGVSKTVGLRTPPDVGLAGAWGMAFTAVFGGVLSLLGESRPPVLQVYLLTGGLLAAAWCVANFRGWREGHERQKSGPVLLAAAIVLGILVLLRLAATAVPNWNCCDDFQAYLVFPTRMLETGSFGIEPYNERRLLTLGGQTFLQTLQLVWGDWKLANGTDLGLGSLVFTGLVAGHAFQRRALPLAALGLLILYQFDQPPVVNISSTVTGLALQYALLRTWFFEPAASAYSRLLLLALTIAGLVSLKNSLLVGCVTALVALWLASDRDVRWRRLMEVSVVGLVAGFLLMPWMLELHRSSGTWFYPLLGKGFHGSVYGDFPDVSDSLHARGIAHSFLSFCWRCRDVLLLGILLLAAPLGIEGSKPRHYRSLVFLSVATVTAAFILSIQAGGLDRTDGLYRYSYPFVMATLFFVLVEHLPTVADISHWSDPRRLLMIALPAFLLGVNFKAGSDTFKSVLSGRQTQTSDDIYAVRYRNAQAAIPKGAVILACLAQPFLLDFQRNTVFTIDHAGGASPPPGIPVMGSDLELAAYLRRQSVRYVMYSYGDEASYGRRAFGDRLTLYGDFNADRLRKLAEYNVRFRDHLTTLSEQGTKIFDDGYVFVLDLEVLKHLRG